MSILGTLFRVGGAITSGLAPVAAAEMPIKHYIVCPPEIVQEVQGLPQYDIYGSLIFVSAGCSYDWLNDTQTVEPMFWGDDGQLHTESELYDVESDVTIASNTWRNHDLSETEVQEAIKRGDIIVGVQTLASP